MRTLRGRLRAVVGVIGGVLVNAAEWREGVGEVNDRVRDVTEGVGMGVLAVVAVVSALSLLLGFETWVCGVELGLEANGGK